MSDIEDLVYSSDDDKRKKALDHLTEMGVDLLKELATDPVLDIAEAGTQALRERPEAPPLKVYFELDRDARSEVLSPHYPRVQFKFPPFNRFGWYFELELMVDKTYPGGYALGFATPMNNNIPFLFQRNQILPSLEGSQPCHFEVVEFIDEAYRWKGD